MPTQVILLQRIEKLGNMGDVVAVKPGYARNYLLPQHKALRASKHNIAFFEAQKKHLEAENDQRRKDAEKLAKKIEGVKIAVIRQASESGQLYGSVTSRDIATAIVDETSVKVDRAMVRLNTGFKTIGLFPVDIALHPEVKVQVVVNIARSPDEAEIQARTGRALVADESGAEKEKPSAEAAIESAFEEPALESPQPEADEDQAAEKPKKARKAKKSEEE